MFSILSAMRLHFLGYLGSQIHEMAKKFQMMKSTELDQSGQQHSSEKNVF